MFFPNPCYVFFVQLAAEHRWQVTCNEPVSRQASMNAMHACLSLPQAHDMPPCGCPPQSALIYPAKKHGQLLSQSAHESLYC